MKMIDLPTLEINDSGHYVYVMQALLKYRGYDLNMTSIFDTDTFKALRAFRKDQFLEGDTVCDEQTWVQLFSF